MITLQDQIGAKNAVQMSNDCATQQQGIKEQLGVVKDKCHIILLFSLWEIWCYIKGLKSKLGLQNGADTLSSIGRAYIPRCKWKVNIKEHYLGLTLR